MGFVKGDLVRVTGKKSKLNPNLDAIEKKHHNKVYSIFKVDVSGDNVRYYLDVPESGLYVLEDEAELAKREELLGE